MKRQEQSLHRWPSLLLRGNAAALTVQKAGQVRGPVFWGFVYSLQPRRGASSRRQSDSSGALGNVLNADCRSLICLSGDR